MNKLFTRIMASVAGFAMAIGVGVGIGSQAAKAVYADGTSTLVASSLGLGNGAEWSGTTVDPVTFAPAGTPTQASNTAKYYTTGSGLRLYAGDAFLISISSDYDITGATFTFSGSGYTFSTTSITASGGSYSESGTTGTLSKITSREISIPVARTCRLQQVVVNYSSSGGEPQKTVSSLEVLDGEANELNDGDDINIVATGESVTSEVTCEVSYSTGDPDGLVEITSNPSAGFNVETDDDSTYIMTFTANGDYAVTIASSLDDNVAITLNYHVSGISIVVYEKVTSTSLLKAGKEIIIGTATGNQIMGEYSSGDYIPNLASTPNAAGNLVRSTLPSGYMLLTLGGSKDAWTFQDSSDRYLNRTGDKKLKMEAASTSTWTIAISDAGVATITTESQSIKYNSTYPRFCVYSSGQADVSIYMIPSVDPAIEVAVTAGSTSLGVGESATLTATKLNGASGTVNWATSNSSKLSLSSDTGDSVTVTAGSTLGEVTITASLDGCDDFETEFKIRNGSFSSPYTVAEARAAIDAGEDITDVYVTGIVSRIVVAYNSQYGNISYNISSDGEETSDQLEAYRGKSYNGNDFTSADDIQVSAIVVIRGNLKKHNSTYELDEGNVLVSYTLPTKYTVTFVTNGSTVNPQTVVEGETVVEPADPTRETDGTYRYTFIAWYDNPEFNGNPYDFDTPVNGPLTLYAKWNQEQISAKEVIESSLSTQSSLSYHYSRTDSQIDDVLNRELTGRPETDSYADWADKTSSSTAVYAGNSAGNNDSIQLRSNNSNSGIVTTTSGGKVSKITVEWNETATTSGRTIDIYGKNSAYSNATDLYNNSRQGTKLGSIVCGTSTVLDITGDYKYIGIRSNNGALYLNSIQIKWDATSYGFTNAKVRFIGSINKDLWNRLDSESTIEGYGIMLSPSASIKQAYESVRVTKDSVDASFDEVENESYTLLHDTEIKNFYKPVSNPVREEGNNYIWSLGKNVTNFTLAYTAVAYIRTTNDELVFLEETTKTMAQAAKDLLDVDPNDEFDNEYLEGSLAYLASFAA